MKPEKLVGQLKEAIEKNKEWTPILGALIGYLVSGDETVQKKIINSLIGAGLGYLLGDFVKDNQKKMKDEEDNYEN